MVVCKYFMQGICKFGDNCRFEHPRGGNTGYAYSAQRQLFGGGDGGGSRYGGGGGGGGSNQFRWTSNEYQKSQQNRPVTQQTAPNDLINSLAAEVKEWERSKMWPLSCIGLEKDSPCVPDLEDTSPEELRHLAYEAQKSNSFQGYVDYVKNLLTDFSKKRQMLSNPNMRTKQKLLSVVEDYRLRKNRSGSNASHNTVSLFSSPTPSQSSGFGNDMTQNSFGATGFGSSTSQAFGTSGMTGSFGSKSGSSGGFGSSGSFGANSGSTGAFGSSNAFGANSKSSGSFGASGDFGASLGSSGGFGSGTSSGGFGTTSFGVQPSAFGNPVPGNNSIGNSSATPASFGLNTGTNVFGNSAATTPVGFGTNSSSTTSSGFQSQGANPFGTSSSQSVDSAGAMGTTFQTPRQAAVEELSSYTPMNRLTAEEIAEFQATHFTLGKIPTKPPPKELCF